MIPTIIVVGGSEDEGFRRNCHLAEKSSSRGTSLARSALMEEIRRGVEQYAQRWKRWARSGVRDVSVAFVGFYCDLGL